MTKLTIEGELSSKSEKSVPPVAPINLKINSSLSKIGEKQNIEFPTTFTKLLNLILFVLQEKFFYFQRGPTLLFWGLLLLLLFVLLPQSLIWVLDFRVFSKVGISVFSKLLLWHRRLKLYQKSLILWIEYPVHQLLQQPREPPLQQ